MSELKEVVVVSGVRLPVGSYGGSLKILLQLIWEQWLLKKL